MRKFLLIFFLLFPIYGACGEVNEEKKPEEIQELFGIKFGNNCNEYVTLEPNSDMYNTKGKVPNKLFKSHIIYCTSLTKRVWKIFTGTIFESETLDGLYKEIRKMRENSKMDEDRIKEIITIIGLDYSDDWLIRYELMEILLISNRLRVIMLLYEIWVILGVRVIIYGIIYNIIMNKILLVAC